MKVAIQKAGGRGSADYGWLKPSFYFSFGNYHNAEKVRFGLLRVLNDDFIAGGGAFPTHPHDNMEIVTIPFTGALKHKDSSGGEGIIQAGDVQIMSAGTGVQHSEANASATDPVTLFQVWLYPKERNIQPRYDQRSFDVKERINNWQYVVSPLEADGGLWINQDARFAMTRLEAGKTLNYENAFHGNGIFLVVISGTIELDGNKLHQRDAAGIEDTNTFSITAGEDAELLAIEVPMN